MLPEVRLRPPLAFSGRYIDLLPLERELAGALTDAGSDPEVTRFMRSGPGRTVAETEALIDRLLSAQAAGTDLCFAIQMREPRRWVGMTRYMDIRRSDRAVEIGGTWLDSRYWRSPFNTEAKLLMLRHAFEVEGIHRVQIKADERNARSRRAIERLGAVQEGIHRHDILLPDGFWRSSVYYSILADEWPAVRSKLEAALARPWAPRSPGPGGRSA